MPYLAIDPNTAVVVPAGTLGEPLTDTGLTLAEMRGQLNLMLGARPDITNPTLDYWINAAYVDIASSLEIDELKGMLSFDLVSGNPFYRLPSVVRAIRMVSVVDTVSYGDLGGRKLTLSDLNAYRRASARSAEPAEYFREKDVLVLYPTPLNARTLVIDVWVRPADLTLDTDSPILPREWHEVILKNARSKAHSDLREFEQAAVAENDFVNLVRRKDSPDSLEESDKIIGSTVPRSRRQIFRRGSFFGDRDGLH